MCASARMARPSASLVPTTLSVHSFWEAPEAERPAQKIQFLKNLSMLGGLLLATVAVSYTHLTLPTSDLV